MSNVEFYYCASCKSVIGVIDSKDTSITCCKNQMVKLKPNTEDAAFEKHVPVIYIEDNIASVFVGEVEHPMQEDHYIVKICVVAEDRIYIKELKAGEKPEVTVDIGNSKKVIAYAYCNKHGLWKSEAER